MNKQEAVDVAFRFVEHINRRELTSLVKLMTAEHRFVDLGGGLEQGREKMKAGWADYFSRFPDYIIYLSVYRKVGISLEGEV